MLHYARLEPDDTSRFAPFVFPRHREYLNRLGSDGSESVRRPAAPRAVAVGAEILGQPVGLAIAVRLPDSSRAQLLSVVVAPAARRAGIGAGLLSSLEHELRTLGVSDVWTRVTEGDQSTVVRRLFDRQGYEKAGDRSFVWYAARPRRLLDAPGLTASSPDLDVVPCTIDSLDTLRAFGDAEGYAPACLEAEEYDPAWSFLARRRNAVVGWILGNADGATGHASALYIIPEQRSLNLAVSLIRTFVSHLADAGVTTLTWEVALAKPAWCRLMDRLLARYTDERLVTHTLRKRLFAGDESAQLGMTT